MSTAVATDIPPPPPPVKDAKKSQQKIRKRNKKKSHKQRQEEEAKRKAVRIYSKTRFCIPPDIYSFSCIGIRGTVTKRKGRFTSRC